MGQSRRRRNPLIAAVAALAIAAIGVGPAPARADDVLRPGAEATFVQLDPIAYEFVVRKKNRDDVVVPFTTTQSRIFYTLQPAETNPDTAPLFVFLNGGPGAATTANFFANNTAPYTLNLDAVGKDPAGVVKNPNSWTKTANLLYIDPSQSGFSYNISPQVFQDPEYGSVLSQLWNEYWARGNFNPLIDADQILRVILTFLKTHPSFADREVVMVGESYGGVRVSTILHLLMHSELYDTGGASFFHDPGLAAMIREHFATGTEAPSPQKVAAQFDRQILVQPQLSAYQGPEQGKMYWDQDPSIIDKVAKDAHSKWGFTRNWLRCAAHVPPMMAKNTCPIMVYVPQWGRDRYDYAMPDDYSDNQDDYANKALRDVTILKTMLGVDPATIGDLLPASRKNAYHTMGLPAVGYDEQPSNDQNTLVGRFGTLDAPDAYYLSWNKVAYAASTQDIGSYTRANLPLSADDDPVYGQMFLQNLRYVKTFLTDAKRDLVIYSPALPEALKRHVDLVKDVSTREETPAKQGEMVITWQDRTTTSITWPLYADAGHAVGMTMPGKLLKDVTTWMTSTGAGASKREHVRWQVGQDRLASWRAAGVTVKAKQPAVKSGATWLFPAKSPRARVAQTRGVLRWQHGKRVAVVSKLVVKPGVVTAVVAGKRVRLLSTPAYGGRASLTAGAARTMNARLGTWTFRAGMPMGRVVPKAG